MKRQKYAGFCLFRPACLELLDCCPRYEYSVFLNRDTPARNMTNNLFSYLLLKANLLSKVVLAWRNQERKYTFLVFS